MIRFDMGAGTSQEISANIAFLSDFTMQGGVLSAMGHKQSSLGHRPSADTLESTPKTQAVATHGKMTATAKGVTLSTRITTTSRECAAWLSKKCTRCDCICKCALSEVL